MTERTLPSNAGRAIQTRAIDRIVVGTVVIMAVAALATFLSRWPPQVGWGAGAVGAAIALAHVTVYLARLEPDSHGYGGEEIPLVAALVAMPEAVPVALVVAGLAIPLSTRYAAMLGRMRTASTRKLAFNVSATVAGGLAALHVADLLAEPLGGTTAGFVAGLCYFAVTFGPTAAILVVGAQRPTLSVLLESARRTFAASVLLTIGGVALGYGASATASPAVLILIATGLLYLGARSRISTWRVAEARDRILREVPNVLRDGHDLEAATLETARRLLGCREARLSVDPPGRTELGVPLDDDRIRTYLIVGDRVGEHRSFDVEDMVLLENLATLAGSARQHRRTLDQLRRSEEMRTAIAGALAHDLRSPLSTVSTGLTTLRRFGADVDVETRDELLALASANVDRALGILDDLLALERLATDPLTTASGDVGAAVREIAAAHEGAVEVRAGSAAAVCLDQRALERILDNLVSNARKHAPGAPVTISWDVHSGEVVLVVEDRGAGIPAHLRESLTRAFTQGDARVAGVGLGLHLARRFTELAGGRLEIGDAPEGGASVRIILPTVEVGGATELSAARRPSSP